MASATICHSTSSGTSGMAKGFTTRKQTSVNGNLRNSSNSCGRTSSKFHRQIQAAVWRQPSKHGAAQRSQRRFASRAPVSHRPRSSWALNFRQKSRCIERRIPQLRHLERAMRQSFIALPPRGNQRGITSRHGLSCRFPTPGLECSAPKHRLWIAQVSLDQELLLLRRRSQVHHGHPPAQAQQQIITRVDHAARGVQHQRFFRLPLQRRQHFPQRVDFFLEVLRLAFRILRIVRPAHPRRYAVDPRIPARRQPRSQLLFDAVIATNSGPIFGG